MAIEVTVRTRRVERGVNNNSYTIPRTIDQFTADEKGLIQPSGVLLIVTEQRDESNLISGDNVKRAYGVGGWAFAEGDFAETDDA